jgi:hypothetical protein
MELSHEGHLDPTKLDFNYPREIDRINIFGYFRDVHFSSSGTGFCISLPGVRDAVGRVEHNILL